MKIYYEFDSEKAEDVAERKILENASHYKDALYDIYLYLRGKVKYGMELPESDEKVMGRLYDSFDDILRDNGLGWEDLYD